MLKVNQFTYIRRNDYTRKYLLTTCTSSIWSSLSYDYKFNSFEINFPCMELLTRSSQIRYKDIWCNRHYESQREKVYLLTCKPKRLKSACACAQSDQYLAAWRNHASLAIQNAHSEDSDQTVRTNKLIWIFAGRTCPKVCFLTVACLCYRNILLRNNQMDDEFT